MAACVKCKQPQKVYEFTLLSLYFLKSWYFPLLTTYLYSYIMFREKLSQYENQPNLPVTTFNPFEDNKSARVSLSRYGSRPSTCQIITVYHNLIRLREKGPYLNPMLNIKISINYKELHIVGQGLAKTSSSCGHAEAVL